MTTTVQTSAATAVLDLAHQATHAARALSANLQNHGECLYPLDHAAVLSAHADNLRDLAKVIKQVPRGVDLTDGGLGTRTLQACRALNTAEEKIEDVRKPWTTHAKALTGEYGGQFPAAAARRLALALHSLIEDLTEAPITDLDLDSYKKLLDYLAATLGHIGAAMLRQNHAMTACAKRTGNTDLQRLVRQDALHAAIGPAVTAGTIIGLASKDLP